MRKSGDSGGRFCKFEGEVHELDHRICEVGYIGAVSPAVTVGNPDSDHYGFEPDIRGECGNKFDVDGFLYFWKIVEDRIPKFQSGQAVGVQE